MNLSEEIKTNVSLARNTNAISDDTYKKLLENCFLILSGREEQHNVSSLCKPKPDLVKSFYAAVLSVTANFIRHGLANEEVQEILTTDCNLPSNKVNVYMDFFEKGKKGVEIALLNIGTHLPHLIDVKWKIDYIVKTITRDESEGPLFRISLISEKFDDDTESKKIDTIDFICTSQELQDLVYKLKDAVRHCNSMQKIL